MPMKYQIHSLQTTTYYENDLEEAVKKVKDKELSSYAASEIYDIPTSTLNDRVLGKLVNFTSARDGVLKGSFKIEPQMCNLGGTIHGGYIASVVDVLSFYSQLSNPDGKVSWTVTMNVSYIAPAKVGETVNVETKSLKSGFTSVVETYLHNTAGNLLAKGTASFIAGSEKQQKEVKDLFKFDVYEK